jgi:hypothetical protein
MTTKKAAAIEASARERGWQVKVRRPTKNVRRLVLKHTLG